MELLIDTEAELFHPAVRSGLQVLDAVLEEDRTAICGPRYAQQADRTASRAGTVASTVVLGGRKVSIRRPRVRSGRQEVPLPTFQAMAQTDPLRRRTVEQLLVGVSTRGYARSLEPLPADNRSRSVSKSVNGHSKLPHLRSSKIPPPLVDHNDETSAGGRCGQALGRQQAVIEHMRALPYGAVADALATVRASQASVPTKRAFEFLVLTVVRSGEVRLATWDEMDLDAGVWTIPAVRMKAKRDHRVPLSERALAILHDVHRLSDGTGLVFRSRRGKALSNMTLSKLIKELGIAAVPHGFRSSFRDWAAERTSTPREVVEAALAHTVQNPTEAAYARSDLFERRGRLMDDWANYLRVAGGRVVADAGNRPSPSGLDPVSSRVDQGSRKGCNRRDQQKASHTR